MLSCIPRVLNLRIHQSGLSSSRSEFKWAISQQRGLSQHKKNQLNPMKKIAVQQQTTMQTPKGTITKLVNVTDDFEIQIVGHSLANASRKRNTLDS